MTNVERSSIKYLRLLILVVVVHVYLQLSIHLLVPPAVLIRGGGEIEAGTWSTLGGHDNTPMDPSYLPQDEDITENSDSEDDMIKTVEDQDDYNIDLQFDDEIESRVDNNEETPLETVLKKRHKLPPIAGLNDDRTILYLHVGKTGGTTLDRVLRSNCESHQTARPARIRDCLERLLKPEPVLSHLTKKTMHAKIHRIHRKDPFAQKNATSFLFTVRNPIDRAISAFNMDHPKNNPDIKDDYFIHMRSIFYDKCFPTIEDLASILAAKANETKKVIVQDYKDPNVTTVEDCFNLGQKTLRGRGHSVQNGHLVDNYDFYASLTFLKYPEKEVLVIRTENLWGDIEDLNLQLADALVKHQVVYNATVLHRREETASALTFRNITGLSITHGSERYVVTSDLSQEGKESLCCILSDENQIFENIVRRATNFDKLEKEKYLDGLYSDCGVTKLDREKYHQTIPFSEDAAFSWSQWSSGTGCKKI